jgi:hypothetical protein
MPPVDPSSNLFPAETTSPLRMQRMRSQQQCVPSVHPAVRRMNACQSHHVLYVLPSTAPKRSSRLTKPQSDIRWRSRKKREKRLWRGCSGFVDWTLGSWEIGLQMGKRSFLTPCSFRSSLRRISSTFRRTMRRFSIIFTPPSKRVIACAIGRSRSWARATSVMW